MLSVLEPGKLVLTFQSIPPFVVESIFALTLALLLAAPLILQVQHFLEGSLKTGSRSQGARRSSGGRTRSQPVVTHYPASVFADSVSSSGTDLRPESVREAISTPRLRASGDSIRNRGSLESGQAESEPSSTMILTAYELPQKETILQRSSALAAAKQPVDDAFAYDYDVYRHKLIEAALKEQYNDYQPPGDVVLNSIHLNTNDSTVAVRLDDRYRHSIFDFVEEHYDAANAIGKKDAEQLDQLDHFLVKGPRKLETVEKETETKAPDEDREPARRDGRSSKLDDDDDAAAARRRRLDSIAKKGSRSSKPPSSAVLSSQKKSSYPRPASKKLATKLPRATSSTDSASGKRDTASESPKQNTRQNTFSSIDGAERDSINCTTISSIDSESVRSESSKHPDDRSCRSRDSSVASTRAPSDRSQARPFKITGHLPPFDKRRSNAGKTSPGTRETRDPSKYPGHAGRNQSSSRAGQPRSSPIGRGTAQKQTSLTGTSNSKSNELRKLEPIRSETEETNVQAMFSPNAGSSYGQSNRPSYPIAKSATESAAGVRGPESIGSLVDTAGRPSVEPRFRSARSNTASHGRDKPDRFERPKSSPGRGQLEQSAKRGREKLQRPRTMGAVSKAVAPGPNAERSSESLAGKERSAGRNDRERKGSANESTGTVKEADNSVQGDQPRANKQPRSTLFQERHGGFDLISREGDGHEDAGKMADDFDRRRAAPPAKHLDATTAKNSPAAGKRAPPVRSRTLRQDGGGARMAARLQDSVRSMPIGSSESPSIERRALKTVHSEDTDANRSPMANDRSERLKLPSRDTKAGIAMQVGLKKYIKKMRRVLSERDNPDIDGLLSLSLTDAILPDIESTLSTVEVQQVHTALSMAEKKSDMMQNKLPAVLSNEL
ncbi:uncharacterized protein LOC117229485 [Megalopta genalis]|uniref:uncharacterized protein LOC117229485 n=1 Tax=Megalopta genalis TaxID=115081 RepID=UPI003FD2F67F